MTTPFVKSRNWLCAAILTYLCLGQVNFLSAQSSFQQQVNYTIDASLDDETKVISASFEIEYFNKSSQDLAYLIFHLWPNAYKTKSTAFADQQAKHSSRDFYFAQPNQMGGYQSITFYIGDQEVGVTSFEGHEDIVKLSLPSILKSNQSVAIKGQFELKLPQSFSRLGHTERSVQLTQWYPKPAVFDDQGWHPLPYLNFGEFYSEFGDFDVTLTLPSKYIVAGTGQMNNKDEKSQYLRMAQEGTDYIPQSPTKTINFQADNVHDFALFMDKDFVVDHQLAYLEDGNKTVDCWAFFHHQQNAWKDAAFFVKRSLEFASQKIGSYPYPHATAVEGPIEAGGGMEYPMVTIIDPIADAEILDRVIAHEVLHNWFYGLLASNERDFPWMDEGFTSYYEERYMRHFYGKSEERKLETIMGLGNVEKALFQFQASRAMETSTCCQAHIYRPINYQLAAYTKPRLALEYLEDLYGQNVLDDIVQTYFGEFAFKHPQPKDVQAIFESSLNMDMSWLFLDIMQDNKRLDYAFGGLDKTTNQAIVENKGEINTPYRVSGTSDSDTIFTTVIQGHEGKKVLAQPLNGVKKLALDPHQRSVELNRTNNFANAENGRKINPIHLRLLPGFHPETRNLYLFPSGGWNKYDNLMLGLHLSNRALEPKTFNWMINPMFGFGSKELVGFADVHYNFFIPDGTLRYIQLGTKGKRYTVQADQDNFTPTMTQVSPYIEMEFRGDEVAYSTHTTRIEGIFSDHNTGIGLENEAIRKIRQYNLQYVYNKVGGIHPQNFEVNLEYGDYKVDNLPAISQDWLRMTLEYKGQWYYSPDWKIDLRSFFGFFPHHSRSETGSYDPLLNARTLGLAYQGYHDILDQTFLGRSESNDVLAHQIAIEEGGFKTAFTPAFSSVIGNSNQWIGSINVSGDLPLDIPIVRMIKPFFDIGYFKESTLSGDAEISDQLLWSAGITLPIIPKVLSVHFPLINSKMINDVLEDTGQTNIWRRTTFSMNLEMVDIYRRVEKMPLML